jgi:hypothetical protein
MTTRRVFGAALVVMTVVMVGLGLYAAETATSWFDEPECEAEQ